MTVMEKNGFAVCLILGIENQSHVHYAMPVKNMLYDAYPGVCESGKKSWQMDIAKAKNTSKMICRRIPDGIQ